MGCIETPERTRALLELGRLDRGQARTSIPTCSRRDVRNGPGAPWGWRRAGIAVAREIAFGRDVAVAAAAPLVNHEPELRPPGAGASVSD